MTANHWDKVYQSKGAEQVSWYQPTPDLSLHLIRQIAVPKTSPIIDVGGGASRLADGLLAEGWQNIVVVDLSQLTYPKTISSSGMIVQCFTFSLPRAIAKSM